MRYLPVTIKDKIAEYMSSEKMICYNSDYILQFTFDAEWDSYTQKTAQIRYFSTNKGWVKHDIIFTGMECNVPVIPNANVVYVGVYAGDIRTTTEAEISCRPSVLSYDGAPVNPPDDVYNQIMQKLNELEQSGVSPEQIAAAVEQYLTGNPITAADVNAVPQNQGGENAGKFMGVNESGEVVPVDAPSGGSGTDIALGITGASAGQIAKIKAVDASGAPTEWEAADIPIVDDTLTIPGEAADAAVVGQKLTEQSDKIADLGGVPDYITAEAERVANAVQATRTAKSLVFPIMSDFHLFDGNSNHDASLVSARYAGMGVKELKKRMHIDFVGYLGDYTWGAADCTAEQVMRDITAAKETSVDTNTEIWCVGNHDINYGKNRDRLLTMDEVYGYIGANSDGVKPFVNMERCYGYIDFEIQKIRVIYLNTNDTSDWAVTEGVAARAEWVSPTQIQWLADTALDFTEKTIPSEWGVVIVGHHPLHYGYSCFDSVMQLLEKYRDGMSGTLSCTIRSETAADGTVTYPQQTVTYDFSATERAEIICNIHGHNHNCGYSQISSTTRTGSTEVSPWLWRFCIPNICANRYNTGAEVGELYGEYDDSGNPVEWTKETGTAKATSFCVVDIDRKNKKIYAYIFGAGKDRVFDYGESEKPAYTNQIPISTGTSDEIYNEKGWKEDTRLNSSGEDTGNTGYGVTGFIKIPAVTSHDEGQVVLRLADIEALPTDGNARIGVYDSAKTKLAVLSAAMASGSVNASENGYTLYKLNFWVGDDGYINRYDLSTIIMNQIEGATYIRFCAPGLDGDSIITVNEPIS